jgi:ABC-type transporter Mla MlaB component
MGVGRFERPTCQWDPDREGGIRVLRLYGHLGQREMLFVLDAVGDRARAPRDVVLLDWTGVEHVDFRSVAGFLNAIARWRDRNASIWIIGATPYVRNLMDVSGAGSLRRALSWDGDPAGNVAGLRGAELRAAERRALRTGAWN